MSKSNTTATIVAEKRKKKQVPLMDRLDVERLRGMLEDALEDNGRLMEENTRLRTLLAEAGPSGLVGDETVDDLRAKLAESQQEALDLELKVEKMEGEWAWVKRLFAVDNQILSAAHKIVMFWAFCRMRYFRPGEIGEAAEGKVSMPMDGRGSMAAGTGLSADTCGKAVKHLHQVGLVERIEQKDPATKDSPPITHILASMTQWTWLPEVLRLGPGEKGRGHGGDTRKECAYCHSDKLVKRSVIVCKSCKREQPDTLVETPVNIGTMDDGDDLAEEQRAVEREEEEWERERAIATTLVDDEGVEEVSAVPQDAGRAGVALLAAPLVPMMKTDAGDPRLVGWPLCPQGECPSCHKSRGYYPAFNLRAWCCSGCDDPHPEGRVTR